MKLLHQLALASLIVTSLSHAAAMELKIGAEQKIVAATPSAPKQQPFCFVGDLIVFCSEKEKQAQDQNDIIASAFDKLPRAKLCKLPQILEPIIAKKYSQQQKELAFKFIQKHKMLLIPAVAPSSGGSDIIAILRSINNYHDQQYNKDYKKINIIPIRPFSSNAYWNTEVKNNRSYSSGHSAKANEIVHCKKLFGEPFFGSIGYTDGTLKWYVPGQSIKKLMELSVEQFKFINKLYHVYRNSKDPYMLKIFFDTTGALIITVNENKLSQHDSAMFKSLPQDIQNNLLTNYDIQLSEQQ